MGRRVFFSFHYQNDSWRVSQVRNSWVTGSRKANKFLDASEWEDVQQHGDAGIKKWIDKQLHGTSVTIVLIGTHTASRKYVNYEIERSHELKKGLLGIYINNIKDSSGQKSPKGDNPFNNFYIERPDNYGLGLTIRKSFSSLYPVYYWIWDDGRNNINSWIEKAAKKAGR